MAISAIATIGTLQVHGWPPGLFLQAPTPQLDTYQRLGSAGSGAETTGTRSEVQSVSCWIAATSRADAQQKAAAAYALCGTVVAVTDPGARSFPRTRVYPVAVSIRGPGKGTAVTGTTAMTYVVSCSFGLEVLP